MTRFLELGVRGRLLLAFLGISGLAVIAAMAAIYTFSKAGDALQQITQEGLPPVLASLELSRQAERIVAAAPTLLAVTSPAEREQVHDGIAREIRYLGEQLSALSGRPDAGGLISVRIAPLVQGFEGNLDDLDFLVEQRLALEAQQADLLTRFTGAVRAAQGDLAPGGAQLDSALDAWLAGSRSAGANVMTLLPQRKAETLIAAVDDGYLRTVMAESEQDLTEHTLPIERALKELAALSPSLPEELRLRMDPTVLTMRELFDGPEGLIESRRREIEMVDRAQRVLRDNAELAQHLTTAVNRLVDTSKADIRLATSAALDLQQTSANVLIGLVILSLLSSVLIVWLYVDRNLVARLTGLSGSMMALAAGDLRTPLPAAGSRDEIGHMARALSVFRDQAIVVEENNLQQISKARQRLVDALESTSEGFACSTPTIGSRCTIPATATCSIRAAAASRPARPSRPSSAIPLPEARSWTSATSPKPGSRSGSAVTASPAHRRSSIAPTVAGSRSASAARKAAAR